MKVLYTLASLLCSFSALADSGRRESITGAVFLSDTSLPGLGNAFRDPAGLVWGDTLNLRDGKEEESMPGDGPASSLSQPEADAYCKNLGARLPTRVEFERLYVDLGGLSELGYYPWTVEGGKLTVLPRLMGYMFW